MKKHHLLHCLLLILVSNVTRAQDPHFSQFFNAPSWVNPALTGVHVDDWRIMGIYRAQWWGGNIAPFTTSAVSVEKGFTTGTTGNSRLGVGLSLLSDASNQGLLKNNYVNASVAYNINLNGDGSQVLGLGLTGSFANRMLDASKFAFQSQYGSMGFQRSTPAGDPATVLSAQYFDVSAGIHYSVNASDWGLDLGAAVFHANGPQESVYNNNTYSLARRISGYAKASFIMRNQDKLDISAITDVQAGNTIVTLGGIYKIGLQDETLKSFHVGLFNRFSDAFYPYVALEARRWLFGLSYDVVNASVKDQYSSVQSFEMSFALKLGKIK